MCCLKHSIEVLYEIKPMVIHASSLTIRSNAYAEVLLSAFSLLYEHINRQPKGLRLVKKINVLNMKVTLDMLILLLLHQILNCENNNQLMLTFEH